MSEEYESLKKELEDNKSVNFNGHLSHFINIYERIKKYKSLKYDLEFNYEVNEKLFVDTFKNKNDTDNLKKISNIFKKNSNSLNFQIGSNFKILKKFKDEYTWLKCLEYNKKFHYISDYILKEDLIDNTKYILFYDYKDEIYYLCIYLNDNERQEWNRYDICKNS
jgi:hypothetical protein